MILGYSHLWNPHVSTGSMVKLQFWPMPASQIFNCVHSCRQNGILEPYGGVKSTSRSGRFGKILAAQAKKSVGMDQDEVPFKLASRFSTGLRVWPIPLNGLIKEISGSQAEEKSEVKGFTSCSTHVSAHVQALFAPWLNILQLIVTALKVYDPHFGIYPSQKNGIWTTTQHKFVNAPQSRQFYWDSTRNNKKPHGDCGITHSFPSSK